MESILLKAKTWLFTIFAEKDMTNILGLKKKKREMTRFNQRKEGGFITQYSQHDP